MEKSSAFYRKATYHRAAHGSTAPSPLVLKELPIISFEGDVRQFPSFCAESRSIWQKQLPDHGHELLHDFLQEQYGDEDAIRNLLLKNLVQLRSRSSATADIRRFHDEAFRVTNELKQLGDDVDGNRFYEQTLISKLSSALKIELIRHSDYAAKKTVTSILDGLRKYTQIMRLTASTGIDWSLASGLAGPPGQTGPRRAPSPYRPRQRSGSRERNPSYGKSSPRQRPGGYRIKKAPIVFKLLKTRGRFGLAYPSSKQKRQTLEQTGPTRCDKAIPKKIQGQTWKEEPRTAPKGRQGTTFPTTSDACKSLSQQQTDAFGNDDLLARRTLWTDRSSPTSHRLRTPEQDRQGRGFRTELRSRTNGYGSQEAEEGAVNPTRQRRSRTEQDNVKRFDKTKAVQYRSGSSSGGSDESEGSASSTTSTTEMDRQCTSPRQTS
ncbi:hypothetical protein AAVH_13737 [Aphelenchoides avenae]|nr:hypothetical protein AAVH_13737 [Aphelenchus avenae]